MKLPWLYSAIVLVLYALLVLGIPLFPQVLAISISGWFNLGMLIFLLLHTVPLVLAVRHFRQRDAASGKR